MIFIDDLSGNHLAQQSEREYNQEPSCPSCGNFEFVKKYKCNDCGEVLDENISCTCQWNLNNTAIDVCEKCGEEIK